MVNPATSVLSQFEISMSVLVESLFNLRFPREATADGVRPVLYPVPPGPTELDAERLVLFLLTFAITRESAVLRSLIYCLSRLPRASNMAMARPSAQQDLTAHVFSLPMQKVGQETLVKHPRQ